MKYYPNNLDVVIQKIRNKEISALLLYGPDAGMISEFIKKISNKLLFDINLLEDFSYASLFSALNNQSFFSKGEIVKVNLPGTKFDKSLEELIVSENVNFPIFVASQLNTSSSIRKFFETKNNIAAIACYPDDEKSVKQIILSKISENKKQIEADALEYLINKLGGDRLLIIHELEKLCCYVGERQKIIFSDCEKIISESIESHPDLLCIYFAKEEWGKYLFELNNLFDNSVSVIWIIRALSRFYQNLLIVKLQEIDGVRIDDAMKMIKPPIFFKISASFKEIVNKISLQKLSSSLENLTIAEIEAKNGKNENEVMDNLFIKQLFN